MGQKLAKIDYDFEYAINGARNRNRYNVDGNSVHSTSSTSSTVSYKFTHDDPPTVGKVEIHFTWEYQTNRVSCDSVRFLPETNPAVSSASVTFINVTINEEYGPVTYHVEPIEDENVTCGISKLIPA